MVYHSVLWLNALPAKGGLSDRYSPRAIVVRTEVDFSKHCRLAFGAYAQVHDDPDTTNTLAPRTRGAICMGPTGNFQGTTNFFCLSSKRIIKRRNFTEAPMPEDVVKLVDSLGVGIPKCGAEKRADETEENYEWEEQDDENDANDSFFV